MHIVVLAWLYVIGMMALTSDSVAGGLAFFAVAGLAPVLVVLWIAVRRVRCAPPAAVSARARGARRR